VFRTRLSETAEIAETRDERESTVSEWVRERLGFEPDTTQAAVLDASAKRVMLCCTRQWGKSTVTAAKAVHEAATKAGSLTLVASPSGRQSAEFLRKASEFAARMGIEPKGDGDNEISLAFPNGSRIVGLPGNAATTRGFSAVSLLLIDEAGWVEDDLYQAMRPVLAVSGGSLWLLSTPHGKRGFFWEAWSDGRQEWERVSVKASECPRISKEWLAAERGSIGDFVYRQEYCCEFVDGLSAVFDVGMVRRAIRPELEPLSIP
jgi:hypothetical protein